MSERYIELAIKKYKEGNSVTSIAKELGIDRHRLSKELKQHGVVISKTSSKYKYDESFFIDINTEEKAYWLGFMYADGYVSEKDCKFELGLKGDDINHVEKFRDTIVPGKPIYIRKKDGSCRLNGTNKNITTSLIEKGCVPNKSKILEFPTTDIVPEYLMKHFLRGFFDGDGCIHICSRNDKGVASWTCGSKSFLEDLKKFLEKTLDISKTVISIDYNGCCEYRHHGNSALTVLQYLYDGCSIYLDRKYAIYCRLTSSLHEK